MSRLFHPGRRAFLGTLGAGLALGAAPELLARDPFLPLAWRPGRVTRRIRGRVTGDGRPIARVAVSDGLRVAVTDRDGRYDLEADPAMPGIFVSTPAGYALPVSEHGTLAQHRPVAPGVDRVDFALTRAPLDDTRHAFVALADPQTLDAEDMARFHAETVPAVQESLAGLAGRDLFGVAVGDIMWDNLALYPEYERAVGRMGVPFAQVVGNHDLDLPSDTDDESTRTFSRHFGPAWFSFNRGAAHYVVLDNVLWHGSGYIGHIGHEQLAWLAQDLALVEPGAPVIVFVHIPLDTTTVARNSYTELATFKMTNATALWRLLEPFDAHVITGHTHEMEHIQHGPRAHEHNLATACGAWWTGPICDDGVPGGFAVYEIDGTDLRWRYQATGRPADAGMSVYPVGSEPAAPGELVANVWDWDPAWTVTWYEGADRRGVMAQRLGRDPLSVRLHGGPDLPTKHGWVDPIMTRHLFYAPVAPGHGPLRVETTDRFGRIRTATPQALPAP
jgi:hypothetical protein